MTTQIPTFPVLYKTSNKGNNKVSRWQVEILPSSTGYLVQTQFGEEGGNQQTHTTKIDAGKAKRSVLEQATLIARSKWNEKTQRDTYRVTNNNDTTPVRPMLAQTYEPNKSSRAYVMPFPLFVQRKYDGIRCISHYDPASGSVVLESRKGVTFQHFHSIQQELFPLLSSTTNIYLDGELYTDKMTFETLNGLVRTTKQKPTKPDETKKNMDVVEYHVYDMYDTSRPNLPFQDRKLFIQQLLVSISTSAHIKLVPTCLVNGPTEIKSLHDQYVQEGFEGIMLRDTLGKYESDKRSKYLQKYKEFKEEEFLIVGFHDGEGQDKGLIVWECETREGLRFSAKPRGTHEFRRTLFVHGHEYIGQSLTVIFQEYSADGLPRFPIGKAVR